MMTAFTTSRPAGRHSRGFSIVELMVSIVIGMLAIMFATKLITGGEKTKQAALGGSDSMQNGMLAMFAISNDATQAGYGLNDPILVGCDTLFSDKNGFELASAPRGTGTVQPLAAAVIKNNGTAPDAISLYSGSSPTGTATVRLLADYTGGTTATIDRSPFGFAEKDVIVVAPEMPGSAKCALAQVSGVSGIAAASPFLAFAEGADQPFNGGPLGAKYLLNATRIFNLGPGEKLSFHTWSVAADGFLQLRSTDLGGSGGTPTVIADNIVSIKAQYGFDTRTGLAFTPETGINVKLWSADMVDADGDGVVGSAGDYQHIAALRLAVIARSKAPERADATGTCKATTTAPVIFAAEEPKGVTAAPITPNLAVADDTVNWQCYRYRVFETIIPIRNTAWRPSAW
jgi:type IV pilus assembly protein PilW